MRKAPFKIGDEVVCISNDGNCLIIGKKYKVTGIGRAASYERDGKYMVSLEGMQNRCYDFRFVKAPKEKEQTVKFTKEEIEFLKKILNKITSSK